MMSFSSEKPLVLIHESNLPGWSFVSAFSQLIKMKHQKELAHNVENPFDIKYSTHEIKACKKLPIIFH